jgi:hypothetical protein
MPLIGTTTTFADEADVTVSVPVAAPIPDGVKMICAVQLDAGPRVPTQLDCATLNPEVTAN